MLQPWSTAPLAGAAIAVAVLTMAVLWAIAWRLRNAGIVDVGWTYLVATLAVMCAALGPGWPSRRLLVAVMFGVWGLRLGTYLLVDRVIGRPPRYHWFY